MKKVVVLVPGSRGRTYQVDLDQYSCQCRDWTTRRRSYGERDPRRLCKHLVSTVVTNGLEGEFPGVDLHALAAKTKGVPLPEKRTMLDMAVQEHFGVILDDERFARLFFLFGSKPGPAYEAFEWFMDVTADGPVTAWAPPESPSRMACERLVWVGLATTADEVHPEALFSRLDLPVLKELGQTVGAKPFAQRRTGIRILCEHSDLDRIMAGFEVAPSDFFHLRPFVLDFLG